MSDEFVSSRCDEISSIGEWNGLKENNDYKDFDDYKELVVVLVIVVITTSSDSSVHPPVNSAHEKASHPRRRITVPEHRRH